MRMNDCTTATTAKTILVDDNISLEPRSLSSI
jgi:hypothetical protein